MPEVNRSIGVQSLLKKPITSLMERFVQLISHRSRKPPSFSLTKNFNHFHYVQTVLSPFIISVKDNARFVFTIVGGTACNVVVGQLAKNLNAKRT